MSNETAEGSKYKAPFGLDVIMELLPHRYPLLLVERVLEMEPAKSIRAIKTVSMNDPWFQGHFPGRPIMPGVLMMEAMAQTGALMVAADPKHQDKLMVMGGANKVKIRRMVVPGDVLNIEVELIYARMGAGKARGTITVDGEFTLSGEITFMMLDEDKE